MLLPLEANPLLISDETGNLRLFANVVLECVACCVFQCWWLTNSSLIPFANIVSADSRNLYSAYRERRKLNLQPQPICAASCCGACEIMRRSTHCHRESFQIEFCRVVSCAACSNADVYIIISASLSHRCESRCVTMRRKSVCARSPEGFN